MCEVHLRHRLGRYAWGRIYAIVILGRNVNFSHLGNLVLLFIVLSNEPSVLVSMLQKHIRRGTKGNTGQDHADFIAIDCQ